jgi:hypothetical protein
LAGCCECGDEPSGSGATELVVRLKVVVSFKEVHIAYDTKYKIIEFSNYYVHIFGMMLSY